jgi:L-amino acid N-acyltransferase YncA
MLRFEKSEEKHLEYMLDVYNYYILNSTATFHIGCINMDQFREIVFFDDELYSSYGVYAENGIIGYCIICPFSEREAYRRTAELTIYLHPDHVRKGYGYEIMEFLIGEAKKRGIKSLVGRICAENTGSIRLCERFSFERAGYIKEAGEKFGRLLDVAILQKLL